MLHRINRQLLYDGQVALNHSPARSSVVELLAGSEQAGGSIPPPSRLHCCSPLAIVSATIQPGLCGRLSNGEEIHRSSRNRTASRFDDHSWRTAKRRCPAGTRSGFHSIRTTCKSGPSSGSASNDWRCAPNNCSDGGGVLNYVRSIANGCYCPEWRAIRSAGRRMVLHSGSQPHSGTTTRRRHDCCDQTIQGKLRRHSAQPRSKNRVGASAKNEGNVYSLTNEEAAAFKENTDPGSRAAFCHAVSGHMGRSHHKAARLYGGPRGSRGSHDCQSNHRCQRNLQSELPGFC
jgi:hypothetical protein